MPLRSGTRVGPYEIFGAIGAGGMGEVYRARDSKLNRNVAIKALPDLVAGDPERVARFAREAQLLAALNHPHIAAIYGVEETHSATFLVLELVDGESLSELLARHAHAATPPRQASRAGTAAWRRGITVEDALSIARQIADALEAAHDKGIIHRDLKPANVMLTPDGQVKVLDFGLGKVLEPERSGDASNSPTMTLGGTQLGMILGTAAYMSPEQAKGRAADRRSDIWAFGCVLYELLAGTRAFPGEDVSDTLASVLKSDVDWSALPADTPAAVRQLLRRCLQKDRKLRLRDIGDVRLELDEAARAPSNETAGSTGGVPAAVGTHRQRRERVAWIAVAVATLVVGTVSAWWLKPSPVEYRIVTRFQYPLPDGQTFTNTYAQVVAISPDGTKLAYIANGQLYLHAMDQLAAQPIRGTNESPAELVFSPDGQWLAYFVATPGAGAHNEATIKKVAVTGGAPVTLSRVPFLPFGASWRNGMIVFGMNIDNVFGIQAVPDSGGPPRTLVSVDPATERATQPQLLDDGKHLLFAVMPKGPGTSGDEGQIVVQALDGSGRKILVSGGTNPHLLPTGHLVYIHNGTVLAVPFDSKRLTVTGGPVPIVEGVAQTNTSFAGQFAIASTGTLVFRPESATGPERLTLVWVDRQGHEQPIPAAARAFRYPRLSPDGTKLAVSSADEENDIRVFDLTKQTLTRLTFGKASEVHSRWTPDGRSVVFESHVDMATDIFRKAADGTGATEAMTKHGSGGYPSSISPDGKFLVYWTGRTLGPNDLRLLPLDGTGHSRPLLADPKYNEHSGEISPDGRWIAYESNESAANEVYVRPFPNVDGGGRWQISSEGGRHPLWARSGRELFFTTVSSPTRLMSVAIDAAAGFNYGTPQPLFDAEAYYVPSRGGRNFDISADGKRFLMIKPVTTDASTRPSIVVVSHWFDEVRAKVAGGR